MKITPNSKMAFAVVAGAMIATSCANDVETDMNVDPTGNAINFAPSVGHSTRATETNISNLGDFAVVARGMHHDGVLYDNFLIGSKTEVEIAKRNRLNDETNPTAGTWKLDRSVYWPTSMENVLFFAYTALKNGDTYTGHNVLGPTYTESGQEKPSFGFDNDNPQIIGYKPQKSDLAAANGKGIWADGENQNDLLVAFTQQKREVSATDVPINFEHALTQVSITARQNGKADDDHRIVKIKGAWIVNATEGGDLTTTYTQENKVGSITKTWKTTGFAKTAFGSFYTDIINLEKDKDWDLLRQHSLMLVPEELTAWNKKDGSDNNGAYILLLCRVELVHNGSNHTGTDIGDIAVSGNNHYHQLFPVNEENYDGAEYGFACVPLSSDWNTKGIGKRYTYNLNICGNGTGAGLYPPTMSQDDIDKLVPAGTMVSVIDKPDQQPLKVVTTRPTKKNVGDNVLDDPIQFTVTVADWTDLENKDWTDGTGTGNF